MGTTTQVLQEVEAQAGLIRGKTWEVRAGLGSNLQHPAAGGSARQQGDPEPRSLHFPPSSLHFPPSSLPWCDHCPATAEEPRGRERKGRGTDTGMNFPVIPCSERSRGLPCQRTGLRCLQN
uniref:Uncharacterized protein n=1 Tax=Myotis myotis TaxID=51298 RepID=A0A7J7XZY2_MYOMY|nr:hypothetical protein mMyoMyo1_011379 [Myotis myotis]